MDERKINKLVGLGILSPVFIIVLYYVWPYIVGYARCMIFCYVHCSSH